MNTCKGNEKIEHSLNCINVDYPFYVKTSSKLKIKQRFKS
jgi:hypothetical protein